MTAESRHDRAFDLTDSDIIRYIDRECGPDEAQRIAAHLTHCDPCQERVQLLQRRLGVLSSLLEEADFVGREGQIRRPRFARRRLRVAATIIVTLGVGFSVTPVRAWVAEAWRGVVAGPDFRPGRKPLGRAAGLRHRFVPGRGSYARYRARARARRRTAPCSAERSRAGLRPHRRR